MAGHDNFNYIVSTCEHRFSRKIHTKTEAYFMWQVNAVVGGTPSLARYTGLAAAADRQVPSGLVKTYGVLNYTPIPALRSGLLRDPNEWWRDERGERSGSRPTTRATQLP